MVEFNNDNNKSFTLGQFYRLSLNKHFYCTQKLIWRTGYRTGSPYVDPPIHICFESQATELFAFSVGTVCTSNLLWYCTFLCIRSRLEMNNDDAAIVKIEKGNLSSLIQPF